VREETKCTWCKFAGLLQSVDITLEEGRYNHVITWQLTVALKRERERKRERIRIEYQVTRYI
jgi:hypothetical protein